MNLFVYPAILHANPHYYDYIYDIELKANGKMELLYGEAQGVRSLVRGKFKIQQLDDNRAELLCTALVEYDPYSEDKLNDLPDFKTEFTHETGTYAFYQEILWQLDDPDERPCLLYRNRYVFDRDPFSCVDGEAHSSDSHDTGGLLDERVYFLHSDQQTLSLKDIRVMGIEPPPFK